MHPLAHARFNLGFIVLSEGLRYWHRDKMARNKKMLFTQGASPEKE